MDLNVFHCGGAGTPIGRIKLFFRRIKWAWQRATKGYCDYDRWEYYQWMLTVLPNCLEEFKDKIMGHPLEYNEEEWEQMLSEIINDFRFAGQDRDTLNRYYDLFTASIPYVTGKDKTSWDSVEYYRSKYLEQDTEIRCAQEEKLRNTFSKLVDIIWNLWD